MATQVAKAQPQELATVQSIDSSMLSMIERAARDPQVDIDKLERLMQMHERAQARQASAEYDEAMASMQPELPVIGERGKAKVNGEVRYTFALWEDMNAAIKPILSKHGFALTFRTDFKDGITVTGVLSHRGGHREETSIKLPSDKTGSKNDVQAVASSVSYGKRYTAGALLNLTSHGEDDDAFAAAVEYITDEQCARLHEWIESTGSDKDKFLKFLNVESISKLPSKHYEKAASALRAKEKAK